MNPCGITRRPHAEHFTWMISGSVGISLGARWHATLCLHRSEGCGLCDDSGAPYRFTMFPTGANITTMRQSRFSATRGTCSHRLTLFVFAMNVVMPPLDTENSQKNPRADELSRNSAEKGAADQRGHERDCCGNQRRANSLQGSFQWNTQRSVA